MQPETGRCAGIACSRRARVTGVRRPERTHRSSAGARSCPGLSLPYDPSSPDDCIAGRVQCVDKTIRDMTRRFDALASSCDHNAIFSLTYLRVTEEYRRTIEGPFFDDTPFVNYEDTRLRPLLLRRLRRLERRGESTEVPPGVAGRVRRREGDVGLGHGRPAARDQRARPARPSARALCRSDSFGPDGTSRKPDHDRVNVILNRVTDDVLAEIARRFDPTVDDTDLPTSLDGPPSSSSSRVAREGVAQRGAARGGADAGGARARCRGDRAGRGAPKPVCWSRRPPTCRSVQSSAARDAFCAVHHDDP